MTGQELYTLFTSFMDDEVVSEPFFYQLLEMVKNNFEMERPWMKLRTLKSDYSFLSSDDYENLQDLPDNFLMTYGDSPLKLISGSDILQLREIPIEQRDEQRDIPGLFYINHFTNQLGIMGGLSKGYSGTLYYIANSPEITESTEWIFPKMAHPLLVVKALILHRGEIDFDEINARMARNGFGTAEQMEKSLTMWDAQLQTRARRGTTKKDLFSKHSN